MTPYEEHLTQSYQVLHQMRAQSTLMYYSTNFCFDRCQDTEELYTLLRTTQAPASYRMKKDLEEKKCVQNCGAKWDANFQEILMETNEHTVSEVQAKAMENMMKMMQQQQQQ
jgi:hypothetical protein